MWSVIVFTSAFGKVELHSFTRQNSGRNKPNASPGLEEPEETVDEEEVETREHHARVGNSDVEDEEDYEDNVEVVGVEEKLEHLSSDPGECSHPHG